MNKSGVVASQATSLCSSDPGTRPPSSPSKAKASCYLAVLSLHILHRGLERDHALPIWIDQHPSLCYLTIAIPFDAGHQTVVRTNTYEAYDLTTALIDIQTIPEYTPYNRRIALLFTTHQTLLFVASLQRVPKRFSLYL